MYNDIVKRFFIFHEIDPDKISESVDSSVHKTPEYLGMFYPTAQYNPSVEAYVSIGDIYGCDKHIKTDGLNVFELLNLFYKDEPEDKKKFFQPKREHNNRSNDNLSMGMNGMIEKINNSSDAMTVCRVDNDNNINLIYTNGMHRYLALRALYLNLVSKYPEKIDEWKKRFTIKVRLNTISEIKTVCAHIIRRFYEGQGKRIAVMQEVKEGLYTGKLTIVVMNGGSVSNAYSLDDNELIEFTKPLLARQMDFYKDVDVPIFKKFMSIINNDSIELTDPIIDLQNVDTQGSSLK